MWYVQGGNGLKEAEVDHWLSMALQLIVRVAPCLSNSTILPGR